ncbi:hypothetical protein HPB50_014030 [Hyalomma asiaticum]|uniref:Uncharacterized protein n=1 Tax=Hyalomma asiaticum TaxID=266040 RepID=A0ACB7TA63_HYAAI|nr:hypothetical protein HPB50_014030 [Hyalomma asiaticum]
MLDHVPLYMQIGLWCYFNGGGPAGLADGAHRPAKTPLFSPTYTIKHSCLHSAGAASGKPFRICTWTPRQSKSGVRTYLDDITIYADTMS